MNIEFTKVIKQLQSENWYNVSEEIEIAKGLYKLPTTFKEMFNLIKRRIWLKSIRLKSTQK